MSASSMFPSFSILLLSFFIPPCLSQTNHQYERCSPIPFNCGKFSFNVTYPFSIDGSQSGCSYPGLHLACTSDNFTQLWISNTSYQVMNIDYQKQILTIADLTYTNKDCPLPPGNTSLDVSLFEYTGDDRNVSFYYCSNIDEFYSMPYGGNDFIHRFSCYPNTGLGDYYYTIYELPLLQQANFTCSVFFRVPVYASFVNDLTNTTEEKGLVTLKEALSVGFDVAWIPGKGWCNGCVQSGGRCGYDLRKPNDPLCYCPNHSYPTSCSLISPPRRTLENKRILPTGAL
ncbi:hypothetical protein QJS10_CPA01g01490 [Acorus calamus]|uniref:Uncharacterized protein n=1 Tax=Acorus calamus TaxID=4465 RepID=A0AAV9FK46_ACOCL|nr:hypothetical protein QJS10_CPA01g01490 [Acorus calamus]